MWKHGEGRPEGPCGLQEVADGGTVSGFWGKHTLIRLNHSEAEPGVGSPRNFLLKDEGFVWPKSKEACRALSQCSRKLKCSRHISWRTLQIQIDILPWQVKPLNVKVCYLVIRLTSDPYWSRIHSVLPHKHTHTYTGLLSLFQQGRAGPSPLQSLAPGTFLKSIIEWAELVGCSESPSESHTEFVFLYESWPDCFCFISLAICPEAGALKMGVDRLIMSASSVWIWCAAVFTIMRRQVQKCTILL